MISMKRLTIQLQSVVTSEERRRGVCVPNLSHQQEHRPKTKMEGPEALASGVGSSAES